MAGAEYGPRPGEMTDISRAVIGEPQSRPFDPSTTAPQAETQGSIPGFGRISAELTIEDFKALGPEQQDMVIVDLMRGKALDDKDPEVRRRNQEIDARISNFRPDFEMAYPISESERNDFQMFERLVNYDVRELALTAEEHDRRMELIAFRQKIGDSGREASLYERRRRETKSPYTFPRPVFTYGDMSFKEGRFDRWRLEVHARGLVSPKELQQVA